jgi:beta-N-acetylhexosaminidase
MTDDLEMGAIGNHYEIEEALLLAFRAGSDCLLICRSPEKIERGYFYLLNRIKKGAIPEDQVKKSISRVITLKQKFLKNVLPGPTNSITAYFYDGKKRNENPSILAKSNPA